MRPVPDSGPPCSVLYSSTKFFKKGKEVWEWSVLVSADDIFCLQQGADSRPLGILKSDAIVVHFTPKILQKLITQLETEPF